VHAVGAAGGQRLGLRNDTKVILSAIGSYHRSSSRARRYRGL